MLVRREEKRREETKREAEKVCGGLFARNYEEEWEEKERKRENRKESVEGEGKGKRGRGGEEDTIRNSLKLKLIPTIS